jgi:hypothetical protein
VRLRSPPDSSESFLTFLPARLGLDLDAGVEHVVGCGQLELAHTAGEQQPEELREVLAHVGVRRGEHVLDLCVDGGDDPRKISTGRADVFELLLEERVPGLQFVELLQRQRVDRPEQPEFTFEFTHTPGGGGTVGQHRHRCGLGDLGFDVEVAPDRLDGRLQPQLRLGLTQLGLTRPFTRGVEGVLLLGACPPVLVEFGREAAHLVALTATLLDEIGVEHLDHVAVCIDTLDQSVDRADVAFDHGAATLGLDACLGVRGKASLGLVEAAFEELLAFVQTGVVHLEVLAP